VAWQSRLTVFESTRQAGRIPLLLIAGTCVSSTTALLNVLLEHAEFANTVVISSARNGRELLHCVRTIELPALETSARDDCLCCGMHSALGDTLRKLFFEALHDRGVCLDRVMIESTAISPDQLAHTLRHTPFLGQRYFHQFTFRVVTEEELLSKGLALLRGLDSINRASQQYLIIASPCRPPFSVDAKGEKKLETVTAKQFEGWRSTIEKEFPYRQVLRLGHDSLLRSLGLC